MTPVHGQSPHPAQIHIVDLFAGPGGLDVAAEALGIPVTGIEWDDDACATRRRAGLGTRKGDVRDFHPSMFPEATVLAGGPPCQTYTVAGSGTGRRALDEVLKFSRRLVDREDWSSIEKDLHSLQDERTGLVLQPLRWALAALDDPGLEPYEAIVLEQVPAVLPVWEAYGEALEKEGYTVDHGILRTEMFGVPQTRRRAVLVARRNGGRAKLPQPTHEPYRKGVTRGRSTAGQTSLVPAPRPWVSMGDVLPARPAEFVVISNYGTGGDPKERGRRLSSEPSATVTGKISRNRVVAPDGTELDRLDFAEAGRLQSFPVAYPWSGRAVAQQIGNAVPPRLALHVLSAALDLEPPTPATISALENWSPRNREHRELQPVGATAGSPA